MNEAKKLGHNILFTTNVSFTSRDKMNEAKKLNHTILFTTKTQWVKSSFYGVKSSFYGSLTWELTKLKWLVINPDYRPFSIALLKIMFPW